LVSTDTSDVSRSSRSGDASDDLDARGRIDALNLSAEGRKVAGSNPPAPISQKPASEAGFLLSGDSRQDLTKTLGVS
jgi:hypothetical protein